MAEYDVAVPVSLNELNKLQAKLSAAKAVLAEREAELMELKGPCRSCSLHYAHRGPCRPERR